MIKREFENLLVVRLSPDSVVVGIVFEVMHQGADRVELGSRGCELVLRQ